MEYLTFNDLQTHIQALYREKDYAAALDLATEQSPNFPEQFHLLYYWRICMAARINQIDLALQLLDEFIESGFWYGETLLRKSPSLLPLQGMPEFEQRVELNRRLRSEENSQLYPLLILRSTGRCSVDQEPCPLLIAMHANASTAQKSIDFWQAAASAGWLVAIPQSTQAMWKGAYVWDDREIAEQELLRHFRSLTEQYSVDLKRVVIAGHSMGGELAVWLAIKGVLPAAGFIAIGPGGPLMDDVENWTALLKENASQKLRGYLILGDEDNTIFPDHAYSLAKILNRAGIPTEIEEIPGVGQDFAQEYADGLLRGLNFIEEE